MRGLINRIRDAFGGGPKLRNKPGGMAWINSRIDCGCGEGALVNRVVKTVRINQYGLWEIEPPQSYVVTALSRVAGGVIGFPGDSMTALAIGDDCLTPLQGDVTPEEVEELHLAPRAPQREKERA